MNRLRLLLPVRVLAFLALPLGAAAQAPPPAPEALDLAAEIDEILATDQIGAASKRVQEVAAAPADVVVLRSGELKALGYRTLGDALGGVLGFRSNEDHAYQGLGSAGTYTLGDQNTRVLVLLDGHALNSPAEVGSSKVGEDFGLPLELVDHIEVVRGPASSLYGNNAFSALVNVVSASASGDRPRPLQAAVTAGSRGLAELWAQTGLTLGGVSGTLMVSGYQRTGTALRFPELQPDPLPAEADREERQSAYLYLRGERWSFAGMALSRTQRLASGPYGSVPGSLDNWYRNRRLSGDLRWQPEAAGVHWLVRLFGDRNEFDDHFLSQGAPAPDYVAGDSDPDRSLGFELQGRATLGGRFTLTAGSERQFHRFDGHYQDPATDIRTEVDYTLGNTYLEGNWQPSARWNLVAGLQWAEWRPTSVRNTLDGSAAEGARNDVSRLTPRLSVIFKPGPADVVKVIYGQGFRLPTIFEEYYTDGVSQSANPDLKPEVLSSEELFWSRKWSPRLSTQGALIFYQGQHSILVGSDAAGLTQYQNAGDPVKGRAVQAEAAWHRAGTELSAGAGWYDWTYQGATLANSSRWLGVLKAVQRFGVWSLAGEARYAAGREHLDPDSGALARVPANWTLRASVRRDWSRAWAQLTVEDLTDGRRRDLVAREYRPVTWTEADGSAVRGTLGVRF